MEIGFTFAANVRISKDMSKLKIFIVEDDDWYSELLNYRLSLNPDYETTVLKSGKELMEQISQKPDIITLDYSLPDGSGQKVLKNIQAFDPNIPVIIISSQEDISTAIDLLKDGAYDYLVKDEDTIERLWKVILNLRENIELKEEVKQLKAEVQEKYAFGKMIKGSSPALQKVFNMMEKACKANITVSVTGETGTGKELVAQAIHHNSPRKKKAFVAVNMAAIPNELMESELFGFEKGAFTGANFQKKGMFEEADKGTIFLDEIGDLDMSLQAKLLRVLQEKEVQRLGSTKKIKIDTRVIVATHKNLAEEVKAGNFRSDLYYRLLGLPIALPPLRERGNDVLLLAKHFIKDFCKENNMPVVEMTKEAKNKLKKYGFPGNIRELKAVIDLAVVMRNGQEMTDEDISFSDVGPINDLLIEEKTLKEYNTQIIQYFLDKYDGDIMLVSNKLDVGKSTIYGMRKKGELT